MNYLELFIGIVNLAVGFFMLNLQAKAKGVTIYKHMKSGLGLFYLCFFMIISILILSKSFGVF